jgi:hypothetical protein
MFDPEYYVGAWRSAPGEPWRTSKYSDAGGVPADAEQAIWERRVFFCVPVPGEAPWARGEGGDGDGSAAFAAQGAPGGAAGKDKRSRGDAADAPMEAYDAADAPAAAAPGAADAKRVALAPAAAAAHAAPHAPDAAAGLPPDPCGRGFILKARAAASHALRAPQHAFPPSPRP